MNRMAGTDGLVIDALLSLGAQDPAGASDALAAALERTPDDALAAALARHLDGVRDGGVYEHPDAFTAFIDHGTNPELYRRTTAALRAVHDEQRPAVVLDIGCGDGRVTLGSLAVAPAADRVVLVEPSAELLAAARAAFAAAGRQVEAHVVGIEEHLATSTDGYDLVQSTYALHNLAAERRAPVLAELARRSARLVIAEFDVPIVVDRSHEHAAYAVAAYRRGIAEYVAHPHVVDGFLVPVLVAQFDPTRPRHTHEQPTIAWEAELAAAGFADVTSVPLFDYWWATARLMSGRGAGGSATL